MAEQPKGFRKIVSWVIAAGCNECRCITDLMGYSTTRTEKDAQAPGVCYSESPHSQSIMNCTGELKASGEGKVRISVDLGERAVSGDHQ